MKCFVGKSHTYSEVFFFISVDHSETNIHSEPNPMLKNHTTDIFRNCLYHCFSDFLSYSVATQNSVTHYAGVKCRGLRKGTEEAVETELHSS